MKTFYNHDNLVLWRDFIDLLNGFQVKYIFKFASDYSSTTNKPLFSLKNTYSIDNHQQNTMILTIDYLIANLLY